MKQNSKAAQRIRDLKDARIAARMPQVEQETAPMFGLLSPAMKAKIGAAVLAVSVAATGVGFTSCSNPTGGYEHPPAFDPFVGEINGIRFYAEEGASRDFLDALAQDERDMISTLAQFVSSWTLTTSGGLDIQIVDGKAVITNSDAGNIGNNILAGAMQAGQAQQQVQASQNAANRIH